MWKYNHEGTNQARYMPTPEQIKRATARIRKKWTPQEANQRLSSAYRTVQAFYGNVVETGMIDYHKDKKVI